MLKRLSMILLISHCSPPEQVLALCESNKVADLLIWQFYWKKIFSQAATLKQENMLPGS